MQALAIGHRRRGHDVAVATWLLGALPEHPVVAVLRRHDVPVHAVRLGARAYRTERRALRDICLEFRPDVVHTHGYRVDVVDRPAVAALGIPTVTTVHGPSMNGGLKGAFYEWLQRRNYRRFDGVVAVSRALRDLTLRDGVRAERLHLVPNAWSALHPPLSREQARAELGLAPDDVVVGWVGRMIPVKGGDVFLRAIAKLPQPRPVVAMIGHGHEQEALAQMQRDLGIADCVRVFANVTEAGRLFAAFDAYVLSSRSEGIPVVILEAMAAGAPIVATRVGGVPEMLGDDEAFLVPPEDPDALGAAIRAAISDPAHARARASRARERLARDFSVEPWLDAYEQVYRGVLAGRRTTNDETSAGAARAAAGPQPKIEDGVHAGR